jgi:hypothetical protein
MSILSPPGDFSADAQAYFPRISTFFVFFISAAPPGPTRKYRGMMSGWPVNFPECHPLWQLCNAVNKSL